MRLRSIFSGLILLFTDILAIISSFLIAYFFRSRIIPFIFPLLSTPLPFKVFIMRYYLLIPFLVVFAYEGLYHQRYDFWTETKLIWKSNFIATLLIMVFLYITKSFVISRIIVIIAFLINIFLLPLIRNVVKKILFKLNIWKEDILFIGSEETKRTLELILSKNSNIGYNLKECLIINRAEEFDLYNKLSQLKVSSIIIDVQQLSQEDILKIYEKAQGLVKNFFIIPINTQLRAVDVELLPLEHLILMKYRYNLLRVESQILKRLLDIIVSTIGLIISMPLNIIIALAIKLSSPGPVLFKQKRVGKNFRLFVCYKFRTMYQDADSRLAEVLQRSETLKAKWEKFLKIENDPRITPLGKFLRKTSLDELPQLWNVLKGEMSLVGPRPYLYDEIAHREETMRLIFKVQPGMTGLWQVSGRSNLSFDERIRLDEFYVRNWSLWLDLVILLKTVIVWLRGEGAF
ncbi:MAG: undecaprenyl-phosphate galactose phosphotransferase WbaP [candidate division WOR-3 bacterium]|nr:undecaprenyl-phosphate galactose phosphotransferase WbaP [candidate division WOR-3 bacterium]MCX7757835.1 undecaprenyl-phosphate galactose phosphotransferase WbaP [candidate division WOR-3 bacterium]MDW7988078.1 undecaprenyl-phosphate galactose phosphotransferase WbaP [candidate division WOR-3 bacterium]